MSENDTNISKCTGDCGHCPVHDSGEEGHSHTMPTEQVEGGLEGWRLGLSAGLVFVFPLLAGLAGAFIARPWGTDWQLGGFVAGILAGVIIAKIVSIAFFKDKDSEKTDISNCPDTGSQENKDK